MKFLILLTEKDHFDLWDAADEPARERTFAAYRAFSQEVRRRGALLAGDALH